MNDSILTPADGERRWLDGPMGKLALLMAMLCTAIVLCTPVALAAPRHDDGTSFPPTRANPFKNEVLYIDSAYNPARATAHRWRAEGRVAAARQMEKIARTPTSRWFFRVNSTAQKNYVNRATAARKLPVLTLYAIPHRDCGSFSAGGLRASNYRRFINQTAAAIGSREAIVVVEPDALAGAACLSAKFRQQRYDLLKYAVSKLTANPNTHVYLDAGNAHWQSAATMITRLKAVGIARADGFSLNVSNFDRTSNEIAYGRKISAGVGGKHFVIDTSRNGNGIYTGGMHHGNCPPWANPPRRALGARPGTPSRHPLVDSYLWIKYPGESDAKCGGYPSAGRWMPKYALGLARRASWGP